MRNTRAIQLSMQKAIVVRGLKFSLVVGTILVLINQYELILTGQISTETWIKIGLTYMVPYVVSTLSSVQAKLNRTDD